MKTVTAFVGSGRRKHTYRAVQQFLSNLQALGEVECEIVALKDYRLEACRGCMACFDRGEEFCPLRDDRDELIRKIQASDGVVFASPNYSFQVSGSMKLFLDRLGYAFHRPQFFGKTWTSIVAQGIFGGGKIVKYLDFVGGGLGFRAVKGSCLMTCEPIPHKTQLEIDRSLARQARRFAASLAKPSFPSPSLLWLAIFRMSRTRMKLLRDPGSRDYTYYAEKGWFQSDFFYPTRLGASKKVAGAFFDWLAAVTARGAEAQGSRQAASSPAERRAPPANAAAAQSSCCEYETAMR